MPNKQQPKPDHPELTPSTDAANATEATENQVAEPRGETMPSLEQLLTQFALDAAEPHDAWFLATTGRAHRLNLAQMDVATGHQSAM